MLTQIIICILTILRTEEKIQKMLYYLGQMFILMLFSVLKARSSHIYRTVPGIAMEVGTGGWYPAACDAVGYN